MRVVRADGSTVPQATFAAPRAGKAVKRGAVIRIGGAGAHAGAGAHSFFLTVAEAEVLATQLADAIRRAKEAACPVRPDPDLPPASAAALSEAA